MLLAHSPAPSLAPPLPTAVPAPAAVLLACSCSLLFPGTLTLPVTSALLQAAATAAQEARQVKHSYTTQQQPAVIVPLPKGEKRLSCVAGMAFAWGRRTHAAESPHARLLLRPVDPFVPTPGSTNHFRSCALGRHPRARKDPLLVLQKAAGLSELDKGFKGSRAPGL
eukprot:360150-Pelagomonas_calceolata.AAC.10